MRTRRTADWLRAIATVTAFAMALATFGLGAACWRANLLRAILIVSALVALVVAWWTVSRISRSWHGAWGLVALIYLVSIPFGMQRHIARTQGIDEIHHIRQDCGTWPATTP